MASILKVDKLDPQSGTALEIGTSGDTITVPSGATLDISASTLTPPATMPASSGINLTALNATNLGSGTVPTARLGTGTASSSNFLRGDNSWATAGEDNTPAFHVKTPGNGAMGTGVEEVIEFGSEMYDSGSFYDTSTYRFTPTVAGKYFLYASLRWQTATSSATRLNIAINKNGAEGLGGRNNNSDYSTVCCSGVISLNGSGDYVDVVGFQNTGGDVAISTEFELSYFGGFRIAGVA
jgi:hypothetical protein